MKKLHFHLKTYIFGFVLFLKVENDPVQLITFIYTYMMKSCYLDIYSVLSSVVDLSLTTETKQIPNFFDDINILMRFSHP